ncbi:MAG: hypothetical protein Q8P28_08630 [Deltaproteobacteria bacterium]|nr:hypothetical protein [Deltaproteobacteria bacterium]
MKLKVANMPRISKAADTPTTSLAPKGERVRVRGDSATRLEAGGCFACLSGRQALSAGICFEHKFVMRMTG